MPIPTYTSGYPPDGSSLGQTKAPIRNNLDGTFQTLAVDHINNNGSPGSQPAGYHKTIHQVSKSSVNTVSGYNLVFSGVPGTLTVDSVTTPTIPSGGDTQLYSLSGAGVLSQLTGYQASTNGYAWIGGILLQWGRKSLTSSSSQSGTINFSTSNVDFPNNIFNMQVSLIAASTSVTSSDNTLSVVDGSITTTSFGYLFNGTSGSNYPRFFWIAIGY